jgi:hypothetical protein
MVVANIVGDNARINTNSIDASTNTVAHHSCLSSAPWCSISVGPLWNLGLRRSVNRMCLKVLGFRAKVAFRIQDATFTKPIKAGTSISGPTTPTNASPEFRPKTATATAIAQLEVVPGGNEGERGRLRVVRAQLLAHPEADQEHDQEVDDQRMPVRAIQKQARWSPCMQFFWNTGPLCSSKRHSAETLCRKHHLLSVSLADLDTAPDSVVIDNIA